MLYLMLEDYELVQYVLHTKADTILTKSMEPRPVRKANISSASSRKFYRSCGESQKLYKVFAANKWNVRKRVIVI